MSDSAEQFTLNIKGPSDLKLSVSVPSTATVADLKEVVSLLPPRLLTAEPQLHLGQAA